jgi:hypothetical protein
MASFGTLPEVCNTLFINIMHVLTTLIAEWYSQLDSAVSESKTGEVVVSPECWKLVKGYCQGELRGAKDWLVREVSRPVPVEVYPSLHLVPEIARALRCHIQKGVMTAIDAGHHTQFHAELRRVSCLFVNLKNLSLDPSTKQQQQQVLSDDDTKSEAGAVEDTASDGESLLEKINKDYESEAHHHHHHHGKGKHKSWKTWLRNQVDHMQVHKALYVMQAILFHYEGVVRQFLVDDKGTVFIGVFGTPMNSHEDDW